LTKNQTGRGHSESKKKRILTFVLKYILYFVGNQYRITVFTGKKRGAGTDADVFITLYGQEGDSGPIVLNSKKNDFEAGQFVLPNFLRIFIHFFLLF
jgi:hypothetical protein